MAIKFSKEEALLKEYVEDYKVIKIKKLLKKGINPNLIIDTEGKTILQHAVSKGYTKVIKTLIENGADINYIRNDGKSLLTYSTNRTDFYNARILIEHGADINKIDGDGKTALMYAATKSGCTDFFNELIGAGANINMQDFNGKTTLMYTSEISRGLEFLDILIEKGADLHLKDKNGQTALFYATKSLNINIIDHLIAKGSDIDTQDFEGNSPLINAIEKDLKFEVIEKLIDMGPDVNIQNNNGETALFHAVINWNYSVVKLLLENGINVSLKDLKGNDAYFYAKSGARADADVKVLLETYGAKSDSFWIVIKTNSKCTECAHDIPLNGPVKKLKCNYCQKNFDTGDKLWKVLPFVHKKANPECSYCGELIPDKLLDTDNDRTILCSNCGKVVFAFSAPEWIKNYKIEGLSPNFIINVTGKGNNNDDEPVSMQPIAVRCISCSAVLTITEKTSRNAKCEHCATVQYLPDPLWLSLHPVKKMRKWFVKFA